MGEWSFLEKVLTAVGLPGLIAVLIVLRIEKQIDRLSLSHHQLRESMAVVFWALEGKKPKWEKDTSAQS